MGVEVVASGSFVLGVSRLHAYNVIGDACRSSDGETSHSAADARSRLHLHGQGCTSSRCDRDAPVAAHTCAARRRPSACRGGGGGSVASRERHGACSSRCNRGAPVLAHTCATPGGPSACRGWGGRSRRASGTLRARLAAIATRRRRHTHVLPGVGPPPAVAGRAVASRERHGACLSRCNRDASAVAHSCAAPGRPFIGRGWGGRSRYASGTVRACLAAIALRRWRHTCVPPGAGPPPAVDGEGGRASERH
jgi:hypothetical protein